MVIECLQCGMTHKMNPKYSGARKGRLWVARLPPKEVAPLLNHNILKEPGSVTRLNVAKPSQTSFQDQISGETAPHEQELIVYHTHVFDGAASGT